MIRAIATLLAVNPLPTNPDFEPSAMVDIHIAGSGMISAWTPHLVMTYLADLEAPCRVEVDLEIKSKFIATTDGVAQAYKVRLVAAK
jgi:hypothetical protein